MSLRRLAPIVVAASVVVFTGPLFGAVDPNPQRSSVAMSPQDSLKQIVVDPGLKVELVASEPLDEHPDWRLLEVGELLHVDGDLSVTSRIVVDARPAIPMDVTYLHPATSEQ